MSDRYLTRAAPPAKAPPDPWLAAALTIAVPVVALVLALSLLRAIRLETSAAYGMTHQAVRTAIAAVLDRELEAKRLQAILEVTPDVPQRTPATLTASDRKAAAGERTGIRSKVLATLSQDLAAHRSRLVDTVTSHVMAPHPAADPRLRRIDLNGAADGGDADGTRIPAALRTTIAIVVDERLHAAWLQQAIAGWIDTSLTPYSRQRVEGFIDKGVPAVNAAVAASVSLAQLKTAVVDAAAPARNPHDTGSRDTGWTRDVSARLSWAVFALLFCLAFGLVVVRSVMQFLLIGGAARAIFIGASGLVAVCASRLPAVLDNVFDGTPLHGALMASARLFGVGIVRWADWLSALQAVGVVLLVAASVATFWVHVSTKEQMETQVHGFKRLYNASVLFLLAGLCHTAALWRWPAIFAADAEAGKALESVALLVSSSLGAFMSVVLIAAYIPTTIVLRQQAISHGVSPAEADTVLDQAGFGDTIAQQALRLTQAALPLLAGLAQTILT